MNEEIRNRNNELNDAALEQVSGGLGAEIVQKVCASCVSRKIPAKFSCTYPGGDLTLLKAQMNNYNVIVEPDKFNTLECPYLKRL